MREIYFRGKDLDGNWREGDLIWATLGLGQKPMILDAFDECDIGNNLYDVDPDTVGQFTGLCDANGREIYEGDVIKLDNEVYTVSWAKYSACWFVDLKNFGPSLFTQYHAGKSIVVGNIHDNSGLLEAKNARD